MLEVGCTTRCSTALQQHGSTAVLLYYWRGYAIYPPPGGTALQRLGLELGSEGLDRLEHLCSSVVIVLVQKAFVLV